MTLRFNLTESDIEDFKSIYYKAYRIVLTNDEAQKEAIRLLEFMSFMFYEQNIA